MRVGEELTGALGAIQTQGWILGRLRGQGGHACTCEMDSGVEVEERPGSRHGGVWMPMKEVGPDLAGKGELLRL